MPNLRFGVVHLACGQALQGALAAVGGGGGGGWEKRKESLRLRFWNLNTVSALKVDAKCWFAQITFTLIGGNHPDSSVNREPQGNWKCNSNSREDVHVVASSPSFLCPTTRAPRSACSQAIVNYDSGPIPSSMPHPIGMETLIFYQTQNTHLGKKDWANLETNIWECLEFQSVFVPRKQVSSCQTYHWPCLPYHYVRSSEEFNSNNVMIPSLVLTMFVCPLVQMICTGNKMSYRLIFGYKNKSEF